VDRSGWNLWSDLGTGKSAAGAEWRGVTGLVVYLGRVPMYLSRSRSRTVPQPAWYKYLMQAELKKKSEREIGLK